MCGDHIDDAAFVGFNIGFLANCILRLKLESTPILAAEHVDSVSCRSSSARSSVAVIFRSNENLMEFAIQGIRTRNICIRLHFPQSVTRLAELKYGDCNMVFVGGMDSYPWKKLNQVYALKQKQYSSITDPFIRHFESFAKFKEFVQSSQDAEYSVVVKLVERYDAQCPQLIEQLHGRLAPSGIGHNMILTTAHKSKGLEFDHVKLGDDFIDLCENIDALSGPLDDSLAEELNILYVAASRARYSLEISSKLKRFLASQGCLTAQPRLFCKRLFSPLPSSRRHCFSTLFADQNDEDCSGTPINCMHCSVKPAFGKRFYRGVASKMVCWGTSDGPFCKECFQDQFAWLAQQIDATH